MEGAIAPVISILDDRKRKLEIGGEIIGVKSAPNDIPSPEIIALEKKW